MRKIVALSLMVLGALMLLNGGAVLAQSESSTITMMEQNNSGQSGTATFTLSEDQTTMTVEINISGGSGVPQPAHIHVGTCDNLDPKPFYPLNNVVNGRSVTVITEESVANLDYEVSNQFAINVHKSAAEASVYVSCGDIAQMVTTGGTDGGNEGGTVVGMPRTGEGSGSLLLGLIALGMVTAGAVLSFSRRRA